MLMLVSCTREQAMTDKDAQNPIEEQAEGKNIVSMEFSIGEDLETRAGIAGDGAFSWNVGDKIAVSATNGGSWTMCELTCTTVDAMDAKRGTFKGEFPEGYHSEGYAVFPYNDGHSYDGTELVVNFPESVSYSTPTPMMYASLDDCQFQHIGSLVKVTYNYAPAGTNKLVASASGIAGTYTVNTADNSISAKSTSNTATYNFWTITGIETKIVYVMLPYGTKELGVSLQQGDSTVDDSSKTGASHEYKKGFLTNLPAITLPQFTDVFLLGDGFECGWNRDDNNYKMSKSGRVYTWTGLMQKGQDFRFTVNNGDWWPSLVPGDTEGELVYGGSYDDPKNFQVDKDGEYTITLDATDPAAMTYEFALNSELRTPLYILGIATGKDWDPSADADYMLSANRSAGFLWYQWTGNLTAGSFKFLTEAGSWDKCWNRYSTPGEAEDKMNYLKLAYRASAPEGGSATDLNFDLNHSGSLPFTISCDMRNQRIIMKPNDLPENIYIVGWALKANEGIDDSNCWTTTDFPLTDSDNDGIYTGTYKLGTNYFYFLLDPSNHKDGLYRDANVSWGFLYSPFDLSVDHYFYNTGSERTYTVSVNINTMKISLE